MRPLDRLLQLHLVAQEHKVCRGARNGGDVCERYLARFVNKQVVEAFHHVLSRKQPSGSRNETIHIGAGCRTAGCLELKRGMLLDEILRNVSHATATGNTA